MTNDPPQLSQLKLSLLRIAITPQKATQSPNLPLVAIRGYYGKALYQQNCLQKNKCLISKNTINCQQKESCLYSQLFKTASSQYIFRNQQPNPMVFSLSSPFSFELILAKPNQNQQKAIISALNIAQNEFFSSATKMIIESFAHSLDTSPKLIFNNKPSNNSFKTIAASNIMQANLSKKTYQLKINLISPLFLLDKRKKFIRKPSLEDIIYALTRRINIWASKQNIEPELNHLLEQSKSAKLVSSQLESIKTSRYSKAQQNKQWLGGMQGHIIYKNVPAQLIPILKLAEYIHLGKDTIFGLGQIKTTWW